MWPGNGEWLFSINIWISNFVASVADMQTIYRDCSCSGGSVPMVPVGVSNSLGLNSIIFILTEFIILILYWA
jgi:hypothetical protein